MTQSHCKGRLNRFGVVHKCVGMKYLLLECLVCCGGRNEGLFIAPSLTKSLQFPPKTCRKSAFGSRTGLMHYRTRNSSRSYGILNGDFQIWLEPERSGPPLDRHVSLDRWSSHCVPKNHWSQGPAHHRTTHYKWSDDLKIMRLRSSYNRVWCTTGLISCIKTSKFLFWALCELGPVHH